MFNSILDYQSITLQFNEDNLDKMLARFLLLLYFATNIPGFISWGMEINSSVYFSLYGLDKVAESLTKPGLYIELSHDDSAITTAEKAYVTLSERGLVNIKMIGPTTYVTVTENGKDLSRRLLNKYRDH